MSDREKALAAMTCIAAWGALAVGGYTPVDQFVQLLRDVLIGLGVFAATIKNPKE